MKRESQQFVLDEREKPVCGILHPLKLRGVARLGCDNLNDVVAPARNADVIAGRLKYGAIMVGGALKRRIAAVAEAQKLQNRGRDAFHRIRRQRRPSTTVQRSFALS